MSLIIALRTAQRPMQASMRSQLEGRNPADLSSFAIDRCQALAVTLGIRQRLSLSMMMRGGAVVARWAHNPKVVGSNPAPAIELM